MKKLTCNHDWKNTENGKYCFRCGTYKVMLDNKKTAKNWEKDFNERYKGKLWCDCNGRNGFGNSFNGQRKVDIEMKSFIRTLLIQEYRNGYNAYLRENKIKNDCGSKSL